MADDRIVELAQRIRRHQDLYYNHEPVISDAAFDALWDELRRLAPNHELFAGVGSDGAVGREKRAHIMPMNSQEKAADDAAFRVWAARVGFDKFLVQYKLDGASLELQYRDGRLECGVTRGDGLVGDDVTGNVCKMHGVPLRLPTDYTGAVRGEVIMEHAVHRERYPDKANCRNTANGIMKRKDGAGAQYLRVLCYDAYSERTPFADEPAKLEWLTAAGFDTVELRRCSGADEVIAYRAEVSRRREAVGFDIDGLVVKGVAIDLADARRARPQKQIAFKFQTQTKESIVRDIVWSESGHLYTPVAIIDPVEIAGTTVRRATLVHPELIAELGVCIGSRVVVSKRGDIIPKIELVIATPDDAVPPTPPTTCATCGRPVIDEGKRVYCSNSECPRVAFHRLQKWIRVLGVKDFGDVMLRRLFEEGVVKEIADLYRLTAGQIAVYEGQGEKSARKALANLHAAGDGVDLATFIAGFGIEGISTLTVEKMVTAGYHTLAALFDADPERLADIHGLGQTIARSFATAIAALRERMEAVAATGSVRIVEPVEVARGDLAGLSFCFTGTLDGITRAEAADAVRRRGGAVRTAVSKSLDYLVTSNPASNSGKTRKARELGVEIVDERHFRARVGI